MAAESTVLMTVTADQRPPSLAAAAAQLGLSPGDLVEEFGVVPIDPALGTYCVEVRSDRLPRTAEASGPGESEYSNPSIAPTNSSPKD